MYICGLEKCESYFKYKSKLWWHISLILFCKTEVYIKIFWNIGFNNMKADLGRPLSTYEHS